jgi:hypothetical protein
MVVSHLTGKGAAEVVRFWGEGPLVREPDLALFGVTRLDPPEEAALNRSTLRRFPAAEVKRKGAAAAAQEAVERIHGRGNEFILHLDVDVIADFPATNYPGLGGLSLDEVREALIVFARQKHLAAMEVTAYNPAKDPDGSGAKMIVDLLADAMAARLETLRSAQAAEPASTSAASAPAKAAAAGQESAPPAATLSSGEAWSSDSLEMDSGASALESGSESDAENSDTAADPDESQP